MRNFNIKKFIKKQAIHTASKAIDIALLLAVGWALGLHLVRY